MSEKSEKCAREIESLLEKEGLYINGGKLRDILAEELEGGGDVQMRSIRPTNESRADVQSEGAADEPSCGDPGPMWNTLVTEAELMDLPKPELAKLLAEARGQRDWLKEECERIGVTVNVIIGAPIAKCYSLVNRLEALLDRQDADHAKYIDWATKELKAQIAERKRLNDELTESQSQLAECGRRVLRLQVKMQFPNERVDPDKPDRAS